MVDTSETSEAYAEMTAQRAEREVRVSAGGGSRAREVREGIDEAAKAPIEVAV